MLIGYGSGQVRFGVALLLFLGVLCGTLSVGTAQERIGGNCTPGRLDCQVGQEKMCDCFEELRIINGVEKLVVSCGWIPTGKSCGQPPGPSVTDCTTNRQGVVTKFANGVTKTCTCRQGNCYWQ